MSRPDARRELFSKALLDQLYSHPNEAITVTSITKACGLSRQSFYYHFRDLHELLAYTLHRELLKVILPVRDAGRKAWVQAILERMQDRGELVERIMQAYGSETVDALLKDELSIHVMRAVEEYSVGLDIARADRALIAHFYTAGLIEIIKIWIADGMRESPELLAERLDQLIVNSSSLLANYQRIR